MAESENFVHFWKTAQEPEKASSRSKMPYLIMIGIFLIFTLIFVLISIYSAPRADSLLNSLLDPKFRLQAVNNI